MKIFAGNARVNCPSGTLDEIDNSTAMGQSCRIIPDSNALAFIMRRLIGYNVNNLPQYILRYTARNSLTSINISHFVG